MGIYVESKNRVPALLRRIPLQWLVPGACSSGGREGHTSAQPEV